MARFDVFANPDPTGRRLTPYVLDVQNDHLGNLATRVVVPCRTPEGFGGMLNTLNPRLSIQGQSLVLDTAALAPVPVRMLASPVTQLPAAGEQRDAVLDALDTLFGAY